MPRWSQDENSRLRERYGTVKTKDLVSSFPGRKAGSISVQALKLGLTKKRGEKSDPRIIKQIVSEVKVIAPIETEVVRVKKHRKKHSNSNPLCVCGDRRTDHLVDYNTHTFIDCLMMKDNKRCVCKGFVEDPGAIKESKEE